VSARGALLYVALVSVAAGLALATRTSAESRPETASAGSFSGGGLAALETWLREGGHDVRTVHAKLTFIAEEVQSLVLAAPSSREVHAEEVGALRSFVQRGGRLVYLRGRRPQPALDGWLEVADGAQLPVSPEAWDPGGTTARITLARGWMGGLEALRVSARRGISSSDPQFLPVASVGGIPVMLWRTEGRGEILAVASADIAENRRLELADNAAFWARLAALGPLALDEYHHDLPAPAPVSLAPWVFGAQAVLCALLLALTRGTPLGPPRPGEPSRLPSAMTYARSFGRLLRSAQVESGLVSALDARLRRTLAERAGVPVAVEEDQVGPSLRGRQPALARAWDAWRAARSAAPRRMTPEHFHELSCRAATVEMCARGVSAGA